MLKPSFCRDLLTHGPGTEARGPIGVFIGGLRRTRMLVRIALLAAIALGIVSGVSRPVPPIIPRQDEE